VVDHAAALHLIGGAAIVMKKVFDEVPILFLFRPFAGFLHANTKTLRCADEAERL
jgi:hypothetical protein